jgi:hypothetical protein
MQFCCLTTVRTKILSIYKRHVKISLFTRLTTNLSEYLFAGTDRIERRTCNMKSKVIINYKMAIG